MENPKDIMQKELRPGDTVICIDYNNLMYGKISHFVKNGGSIMIKGMLGGTRQIGRYYSETKIYKVKNGSN